MEKALSFTLIQQVIIFILQAWVFIGFPVLVLRKLNYIASLLETQIYEDDEEEDAEGDEGDFDS